MSDHEFDAGRADIAVALSNIAVAIQHVSIAVLAAYKREPEDMLAKLDVANDAVDRIMEIANRVLPLSDNDDDAPA